MDITFTSAIETLDDLDQAIERLTSRDQLAPIVAAMASLPARKAKPRRAEIALKLGVSGAEIDALIAGARAPADGDLARGDETELATLLLEDLRDGSPEPLVADEGKLWRFDASGIWTEITDDDAGRAVHGYAGLRVGEKRTLSVGDRAVRGTIASAHRLASRPGYFADAPHGIAFVGEFLRADTITLEPLRAEHRARFRLPFAYDPKARAPRWLRFLLECHRSAGRGVRIGALQEWTGAALLGQTIKHAKALVLVGDGSNGKSVFLSTLRELFSAEVVCSLRPHDLDDKDMRATLAGKRLNLVAEIPERKLLESGQIKAAIDGSPIQARHVYRSSFNFRPVAAHIFAANQLPATDDQSAGFWRRFVVVEWSETFAGSARDLDLAEKLRAELPGIVSWALRGARRLAARGAFVEPREAIEEWQRDTCSVRSFKAERLVPADVETPALELWSLYADWCRERGIQAVNIQTFGRRMRAAGVPKRRIRGGYVYPARYEPQRQLCSRCRLDHDEASLPCPPRP